MSSTSLRRAIISRDAIRHNVATLRSIIPGREVMAVVKADAYGHGAIESARAAVDGGATWLGVADVDEAMELREAGIQEPILCWIHGPYTDFSVALTHKIDLGVSSLAQLETIAEASRGRADNLAPLGVHLKFDTGLGRNGFAPGDALAGIVRARELEADGDIRIRGLFSHLSNASRREDREAIDKLALIVELAAQHGVAPRLTHIAASAATLRYPELPFSMVRIGLMIYGLSPLPEFTPADIGLKPAMRLESTVLSVRRVPGGSGVSYDYTYTTSQETTLVLVGMGYADGIPRSASNSACVSLGGKNFRISGRVAMDQFVVDVGDTNVSVGDPVILFGDPLAQIPSVEDFAEASGTINYEIITRLGRRVERIYT
ncbi:alanine racemase [Lysinibacter sp. HNR]|uniref:alanine racemase n=1 Tax=Lysinibacter sp. HNR TaxID=3031408 RepID=UPI002434DDE8|nr:alanine racemase [Lysinibacter sp. HNR]WGD36705.1 alanine racemase [Lysinibacter sp. HNR]